MLATATRSARTSSATADISYIGPCDASEPTHTVRLWIDRIEDLAGDPLDDFRDPCPYTDEDPGTPGGCVLPATCVENGDTPVEFNIVVMRQARQGFFDIAVNFEDVFCSAKLDCTYDDAGTKPIELLHDLSGERTQTAVIGFACTGGPGAEGTVLHMNDVVVACDGTEGPTLVSSVALTSTFDGSPAGFEVVYRNFGEDIALEPRVWPKTGDRAWGAGVALETGPVNAGQVLSTLDDDRLFGIVFSTLEDEAGPHHVVWQRNGSNWDATFGPESTMEEGLVSFGFDAALGRVWLTPQNSGEYDVFVGYWDIGAENAGVKLPGVDEDGCVGSDFEGELAVGGCYGGPVVWDTSAGTVTYLAPLFDPGEQSIDAWPLALLSDQSIVGVVRTNDGSHVQLTRWTRDGSDWIASALGPDEPSQDAAVIIWERDDYFLVGPQFGGQPTLYHPNGGGFDTWTSFTLGGEQVFVLLQGIATGWGPGPVVFGLAASGEEELSVVAGIVGPPGEPIQLVTLPYDGDVADLFGQLMVAHGTHDGDLWLVASEGYESPQSLPIPVWALSLDGGLHARDFRTLEPSDAVVYDLLAKRHRGPVHAVGAIAATGGDPKYSVARAEAWDPFVGASNPTPQKPSVMSTSYSIADMPYEARLDPSIEGNAYFEEDAFLYDAVLQYAVYHGNEQLECNGQPCNKQYWDLAIAFDPSHTNCSLRATATAASAGRMDDGVTPDNTNYPFIVYDVPLTVDGEMVCRRNGLDHGGGVSTQYTAFDEPMDFCYSSDGNEVLSHCNF